MGDTLHFWLCESCGDKEGNPSANIAYRRGRSHCRACPMTCRTIVCAASWLDGKEDVRVLDEYGSARPSMHHNFGERQVFAEAVGEMFSEGLNG